MIKNFLKLLPLLYLLPFLVFASSAIHSAGYKEEKSRITLKVAIEGTGYFPFSYFEGDEKKGFSIDVINYIKANSKYDFEYVTQPWSRALSNLEFGNVDLILTLFSSPEREEIYHIIQPSYGFEANQLFSLVDTTIKFDGRLQQLSSYSIGTKRAYSYGKAFDQADYIKKYEAISEDVLLKILLARRVDAIIGNPFMINRVAIKENITTKIKSIVPYASLTPVHLALTKKREDSQEIKNNLESVLKQLKASLYYQQLLEKYQLNFQ